MAAPRASILLIGSVNRPVPPETLPTRGAGPRHCVVSDAVGRIRSAYQGHRCQSIAYSDIRLPPQTPDRATLPFMMLPKDSSMTRTITRLYDDYAHAAAAAAALERLGVARSDIGLVANNLDGAGTVGPAAGDYTLRDEGAGH